MVQRRFPLPTTAAPVPRHRFSSHPPLRAILLLAWILCLYAGGARGSEPQCDAASAPGQVARGQALPEQLNILSWNIQKAGNAGWAEDLAELAGSVHLAFLQEASLQAQISALLPRTPHRAFAAGYRTDELDTGVMTLSASTPSLLCHFTVQEPWLGTPKAASITEYPLADRAERLLAINLHAVNFALGLTAFRDQFERLATLLGRHQGPVILAGDLNTWSSARQLLVDGLMREHGLAPVVFRPDLRTTAFGRALDHIYVRGLQAEFAQVLPVSSSDHNPLLARLRFQR